MVAFIHLFVHSTSSYLLGGWQRFRKTAGSRARGRCWSAGHTVSVGSLNRRKARPPFTEEETEARWSSGSTALLSPPQRHQNPGEHPQEQVPSALGTPALSSPPQLRAQHGEKQQSHPSQWIYPRRGASALGKYRAGCPNDKHIHSQLHTEGAYCLLTAWWTQELEAKSTPGLRIRQPPGSPLPPDLPGAPQLVFLQDGGPLCHLLPELASGSVSKPMMLGLALRSPRSSEGAMAAATAPGSVLAGGAASLGF